MVRINPANFRNGIYTHRPHIGSRIDAQAVDENLEKEGRGLAPENPLVQRLNAIQPVSGADGRAILKNRLTTMSVNLEKKKNALKEFKLG